MEKLIQKIKEWLEPSGFEDDCGHGIEVKIPKGASVTKLQHREPCRKHFLWANQFGLCSECGFKGKKIKEIT